jgi:parallel beta-helix repeat protein
LWQLDGKAQMVRVPFLATILLALQALAAVALPPAMPSAAEIDALRTRLHDSPLPQARPGRVRLLPADQTRGAGHLFRTIATPPGWRGMAIVLEGGPHHLPAVAAALPPGWLDCTAITCTLTAPVMVTADATLVIDGIDLVLSQDHGAMLLSWGHLVVSDSTLRAWNLGRDAAAETDHRGAAFRPHVAAFADSHTLIRRSTLAHLGHQAPMSYGLSFGTENRILKPTAFPSVDMIGNRLSDVYFGFYSFDAEGVNVVDNHIAESHVYGIDPHDDTRAMLIHGNHVYGTRRSHGIILSRRIHDTVVSHNISAGNAKAGFFVDKASHDVLITGNDSYLNGAEGLVLHEVTRIAVVDNRFHNNGGDGIRLRASSAILLDRNDIAGNGKNGLRAYDWQGAKRAPNAEEAGQIEAMRLSLAGNRVRGNAAHACRLTGDARVMMGQPHLCPAPPVAALPARSGPAAGNAP